MEMNSEKEMVPSRSVSTSLIMSLSSSSLGFCFRERKTAASSSIVMSPVEGSLLIQGSFWKRSL